MVAGFAAMALGEAYQARDLGRFRAADTAGEELTLGQRGAPVLIVLQPRLIDGIVPQDRPAKQSPLVLSDVRKLGKLAETFVEMPLAMIVPPRRRIGGSGPEFGFDQTLIVTRTCHRTSIS